jgi:hypothetical protein
MGKVVNCKVEKYNVYIGRPSKWGNPFVLGRDGDRKEVLEKYRDYLALNPSLVADMRVELKGKILGCFCKPLPCHGDIILELLKNEEG